MLYKNHIAVNRLFIFYKEIIKFKKVCFIFDAMSDQIL